MLTEAVARKKKSELGKEMESFHEIAVDIVGDMLLNLFTRAGAPYQFKATHAWAWPKEASGGIPTALCLN